MSGFDVISGVTSTLSSVIKADTGVDVTDDKSPNDVTDTAETLSIYLYRVEHNPAFVNAAEISVSPTQIGQGPIGLNLYYLFTPFGKSEKTNQKTLGEVIKLFHQMQVIPPARFDPALAGATEELRVIPRSMAPNEFIDLWRAFDKVPYHVALVYEISTVLIDSDVRRDVVRVDERRLNVATKR